MQEYKLRVPQLWWNRVKMLAAKQGVSMKTLIVKLLETELKKEGV